MAELNEFVEILGSKKEPMQINLNNAKAVLCRGLRYFIGDDARWLQGYDEISSWLEDNQRKGLLLYGANGRGKTMMCYNIIPTILAYYFKQVKTFKIYANNLRSLHSENNGYYALLMAEVVFVDDFGTESITSVYGDKRDIFSEVVDLAEQQKKLLVLSTNLTPKEIKARYGLRTLDRLQSITRAICLNGESLRKSQQPRCVE